MQIYYPSNILHEGDPLESKTSFQSVLKTITSQYKTFSSIQFKDLLIRNMNLEM